MKKLLMLFPLLTLVSLASAQATNPQRTFWGAEWTANPALAMNFDEPTTAFKDQVSGTTLSGSQTTAIPLAMTIGASAVNTPSGTASTTATCSLTTTGSGAIVAFVYSQGASLTGITDSGGTTGSQIVSSASNFGWVFSNVSAGTHTLTATIGTAEPYIVFQCAYINNAALSSPVVTSVSNTTGASSTTFTSGNLTTTGYPEMLMGFQFGSTNTFTLNGGFVALGHAAWTGIYQASYLISAPGTYAFSGTQTNTSGYTTLLIAIKPQMSSTVYNSGTVVVQQPGFDSANNSNYSAEFPYNGWSAAPNAMLSTIDWNHPWSMLLHIDNFNWDHTGTLILASKGDLGGCLSVLSCPSANNFWKVSVKTPESGGLTGAQLCFARNGYYYPAGQAYEYMCSNLGDAMPNGMNYDIVIEDTGAGNPASLSMYLNGLAIGQTSAVTSSNQFGAVTLAITSGGTGYAASTTFNNGGTGGANCTVQGTATATSGVITSISITPGYNYGCTSTPTISFVSPTGTGGSITATSYPWTMNSSTSPLMVPGYISNGVTYGVDGPDASQNPVYVDEFALFNSDLTFGQVSNLFYTTKFWQSLLYPGLLANPPLVILGGWGCGPDFSGDQTLAMTIGAARQGLIRLIGVTDDDGNPNGSNSVGWWRQMLDQAGLNDVPVSIGTGSADALLGGCPAATITAYNASTPQNAASYESAVTMYRTLFAQYSTQPIYVLVTQTGNGYAEFLTSPADGISSLTGLQLQAQNAANGGWVNLYQGNLSLTPTYYQTIYNNNGTMPIYIFGGSPLRAVPASWHRAHRTILCI